MDLALSSASPTTFGWAVSKGTVVFLALGLLPQRLQGLLEQQLTLCTPSGSPHPYRAAPTRCLKMAKLEWTSGVGRKSLKLIHLKWDWMKTSLGVQSYCWKYVSELQNSKSFKAVFSIISPQLFGKRASCQNTDGRQHRGKNLGIRQIGIQILLLLVPMRMTIGMLWAFLRFLHP